MEGKPNFLVWLVSPTRIIFECTRPANSGHSSGFNSRWANSALILELIVLACLSSLSLKFPSLQNHNLAAALFSALAISRIVEIAYAFGKDSNELLDGLELPKQGRVVLVAKSYFGLAFYFSLLFYFCVSDALSTNSTAYFTYFYFSIVTITTLGYGEIAPSAFLSELFVIVEVLLGLFLIVVAFGAYLSSGGRDIEGGSKVSDRDPIAN